MTNQIIIYYKGDKYDVTNYITSHPGGNIIKQYNGMDITQIFHRIGHSDHALNILKNLATTKTQNTEPIKMSNLTPLQKLNTHEDPYNIHKIAGVISLISFILILQASAKRLLLNNYTKTIFCRPTKLNCVLIIVNLFLVLSSLQFEVSKKKSVYRSQSGLFETSEKRLHSIIFSMRSLMAIIIVWTTQDPKWKLILLIFITHFAADCVTAYYKGNDISTIQSLHNNDVYRKVGTNFASLAQLGAITMIGGFGVPENRCDNMFLILMSIQLSVFFDTLVKKNIMHGSYVGYAYTLSLIITLLQLQYNNSQYLLWLIFGILRMYFRVNKYLLYVLILPFGSFEFVDNNRWIKYVLIAFAFLFCLFLAKQRQSKRYIQCFLGEDYKWEKIKTMSISYISVNTLRVKWGLDIEYVNKLSLGKYLKFRFPNDNSHIRPFSPINNQSDSFETRRVI